MDIGEKEATAVMTTDPGTGGNSQWRKNTAMEYTHYLLLFVLL